MMTTGTTPAAGVDHPVAHALVDALALLVPVADPAEARVWQLGDDQCLLTMLTLHHLEAAVAAVKLGMLAVMEERQVTVNATGLGTAAWLNGTSTSSLTTAHRDVALANGVHRRFPAITMAMAAGSVSPEQAAAIVGVLKKLPDSLTSAKVAAAEKMTRDQRPAPTTPTPQTLPHPPAKVTEHAEVALRRAGVTRCGDHPCASAGSPTRRTRRGSRGRG